MGLHDDGEGQEHRNHRSERCAEVRVELPEVSKRTGSTVTIWVSDAFGPDATLAGVVGDELAWTADCRLSVGVIE